MFNSRINNGCPFYSDGSDNDKKVFKITWNTNVDTVFNIVVRALLLDRIEEDADFKIRYNEITHNADFYENGYTELHHRLLAFEEENKEDLWLVCVRKTTSEWFDKLSTEVKENAADWTEVAKVRKFFSRTDVTCFTKGKQTIVVFRPLDNMALETERYVLMGTPVYIPWFFKEKPITKEETEFLETLSKTTSEPFMKAAASIAVIKDVRSRKMECQLAGVESRFAQSKLEYYRIEIDNLARKIEAKRNEISELLVKIRDNNLLMNGLRNIVKNDNNEILDFFKANKNLVFKECYGDNITFEAIGYLDVFDTEAAEEFIDNPDSLIYDYTNINKTDTKNLFKAIFVDQTVKLKSVAEYTIKIGDFHISGIMDAYYLDEVKDYFPNPHIDRYHCLGDYETMMIDALKEGNVIGCLSLCGMSARSLNFGDSTVMEEFTNRITRTQRKAFELNGNSYSLKEILEELRKED